MKHTVYLSGPMGGCSYEEMTGWRKQAESALNSENVRCTLPTRSITKNKHPYETERWINRRDHFDCTKAAVILVNLQGMKTISIGTVMEIAWAYDRQIPVIAIVDKEPSLHFVSMEEGAAVYMKNPEIHKHPMMIDSITQVVYSVDEGIAFVKELLSEERSYE